MRNDDFILDSIFNILQADTEKPEDGYFRSDRERAYRCEALRQIFCGLQREGQDSQGIGVKSEIVVKGGAA